MPKLSARGFWIGTVCLFCAVLLIHSRFYIMPDAISTATGTMLGAYIPSWIIWHIIKYVIGPERTPERLRFIFVLACFLLVLSIWNEFKI